MVIKASPWLTWLFFGCSLLWLDQVMAQVSINPQQYDLALSKGVPSYMLSDGLKNNYPLKSCPCALSRTRFADSLISTPRHFKASFPDSDLSAFIVRMLLTTEQSPLGRSMFRKHDGD